ncbi:unnamed protein product [Rotaria magnacalcarata]|uniref:RING-type domain-containing protein n=2 Tax=Rotaria magnacalcarata TaxID=392030 RepID=A0A814YVW8_9BILA|nr:unnamed protein product [Rotaria magnacalcarata]
MSQNVDYDYENEELIDINLKCSICNEAMIDPVVTQCHHSFCRLCLEKWIQTDRLTCPSCRNGITINNSTAVTLLNFISMLDRILVKCKLCQQSNIQRGNFQDHIDKICTRKIIICKANVNGCSWSGPREQFQIHLDICTYLSLNDRRQHENSENVEKTTLELTHNHNFISQEENINGDLTLSHENEPIQIIQNQTIGDRIRNRIANCECVNLHIFDEHITAQDMLCIVSAFPNNTTLKYLELAKCSLRDIGVMFLTTHLSMCTHLQYLDLYDNSITDKGVQYLSNMLQLNRSLSVLRLGLNNITNKGLEMLVNTAVNHNQNLKHLSLFGNKLIDASCIYSVFHLIRNNRSIKKLNLEECNIFWHARKSIQLYRIMYYRTDLQILL